MTAVLVDTNVLVYAHDRGEPEKQARAIEVLAWLEDTHRGRLSVLMLAEFFSLTTRGQTPKRIGYKLSTARFCQGPV